MKISAPVDFTATTTDLVASNMFEVKLNSPCLSTYERTTLTDCAVRFVRKLDVENRSELIEIQFQEILSMNVYMVLRIS